MHGMIVPERAVFDFDKLYNIIIYWQNIWSKMNILIPKKISPLNDYNKYMTIISIDSWIVI